MPQLQLRTKQHSVPFSKNWFWEGIPQSSADQLRDSLNFNTSQQKKVLVKESLKDLFHLEICENKVVSSPSRSAFDLNVHGVKSQHPFTPPYPFTIYCLETADANLICFAIQTVLNSHYS